MAGSEKAQGRGLPNEERRLFDGPLSDDPLARRRELRAIVEIFAARARGARDVEYRLSPSDENFSGQAAIGACAPRCPTRDAP